MSEDRAGCGTRRRGEPEPTVVTIAHTPDTDDAFYYAALRDGAVGAPDLRFRFVEAPIADLNRAAADARFDVTAVSSAAYPGLAAAYRVLSAGTSVGRGYGPLLASRDLPPGTDLGGRRVGIAGRETSGGLLLRLFHPRAVAVEWPCRDMVRALREGELDAAVLIHEDLLLGEANALVRMECLGARWCESRGLPLPVGLNLIRRDLPLPLAERIDALIRGSLRHGLDHRRETLARVAHHDRGAMDEFVAKFANGDSLRMPPDVRRALDVFLGEAASLQGVRAPDVDLVEGQLHDGSSRGGLVSGGR